MKYLEAVTVCVDYTDFLNIIANTNKKQFDRWIIVTSHFDKKTQRACEYHGLECVKTNSFYDNGNTFNKGKALNEGFKRLNRKGWVLHLDCDIMLPSNFREVMNEEFLQTDAIYGVDRVNVIGGEQMLKLLSESSNQIQDWIFIDTQKYADEYGFSPRVYSKNEGNHVIGFFQLFHGSNEVAYPQEHTNAARTDMQFGKLFPLNKRLHYPGVIAYHLESEKADKMGINWDGRKTKMISESLKPTQYENTNRSYT